MLQNNMWWYVSLLYYSTLHFCIDCSNSKPGFFANDAARQGKARQGKARHGMASVHDTSCDLTQVGLKPPDTALSAAVLCRLLLLRSLLEWAVDRQRWATAAAASTMQLIDQLHQLDDVLRCCASITWASICTHSSIHPVSQLSRQKAGHPVLHKVGSRCAAAPPMHWPDSLCRTTASQGCMHRIDRSCGQQLHCMWMLANACLCQCPWRGTASAAAVCSS